MSVRKTVHLNVKQNHPVIKKVLKKMKALKFMLGNYEIGSAESAVSGIKVETECPTQFVHTDYDPLDNPSEPPLGTPMSMLIALGGDTMFNWAGNTDIGDYSLTHEVRLRPGDVVFFSGMCFHAGGRYVGPDCWRIHFYLAPDSVAPKKRTPDNVVYPLRPKKVVLWNKSKDFQTIV